MDVVGDGKGYFAWRLGGVVYSGHILWYDDITTYVDHILWPSVMGCCVCFGGMMCKFVSNLSYEEHYSDKLN